MPQLVIRRDWERLLAVLVRWVPTLHETGAAMASGRGWHESLAPLVHNRSAGVLGARPARPRSSAAFVHRSWPLPSWQSIMAETSVCMKGTFRGSMDHAPRLPAEGMVALLPFLECRPSTLPFHPLLLDLRVVSMPRWHPWLHSFPPPPASVANSGPSSLPPPLDTQVPSLPGHISITAVLHVTKSAPLRGFWTKHRPRWTGGAWALPTRPRLGIPASL